VNALGCVQTAPLSFRFGMGGAFKRYSTPSTCKFRGVLTLNCLPSRFENTLRIACLKLFLSRLKNKYECIAGISIPNIYIYISIAASKFGIDAPIIIRLFLVILGYSTLTSQVELQNPTTRLRCDGLCSSHKLVFSILQFFSKERIELIGCQQCCSSHD